jgi:hypothetical protein
MIKLQAAVRLNATRVTASYEGTKVRDLNQYVRSLGVGVAPQPPGGGGGGPQAGMMMALVDAQKAHALATKLIGDGWTGRLAKKKVKDSGPEGEFRVKEIEYMVYTCPSFSERNVAYPSIKMSKPDSGNKVRITLQQITDSAARNNARQMSDQRNQRRVNDQQERKEHMGRGRG